MVEQNMELRILAIFAIVAFVPILAAVYRACRHYRIRRPKIVTFVLTASLTITLLVVVQKLVGQIS